MATYTPGKTERFPNEERIEREEVRLRSDAKPLAKRGSMDMPLLILTLIILTVGVVMVLSASFASAYYTTGDPTKIFVKQLLFAVSGVALMLLVSRIHSSTFQRWAGPLMLVSILCLLAIPFVGTKVNGARRWFDFGITQFQPSELAKLAEVLFFSVLICRFKGKMRTFKYGIAPFAAVILLIVGLLYLEPHLSASVIIISLGAILMFAGGVRLYWFIAGGGIFAAAAYFTVTKLAYASDRITAWLNPAHDMQGKGYQIMQSLYAVGSGGLFGLGLGQSRQKYLYLPEEHNDYIFAVVCEELGYIGAILILFLFALLVVRGFWLAMHAKDRFGSLVITGLTSLLAIQVFLNIAVVVNLIPSTGISLPFFSYGGSALWIQMIEMGIILSISRDIPVKKSG